MAGGADVLLHGLSALPFLHPRMVSITQHANDRRSELWEPACILGKARISAAPETSSSGSRVGKPGLKGAALIASIARGQAAILVRGCSGGRACFSGRSNISHSCCCDSER